MQNDIEWKHIIDTSAHSIGGLIGMTFGTCLYYTDHATADCMIEIGNLIERRRRKLIMTSQRNWEQQRKWKGIRGITTLEMLQRQGSTERNNTKRESFISKHISMQKIPVKPLSVNECWQGKRFKTPKYNNYEKFLMMVIKNEKIPEWKLVVHYRFWFSNSASDVDNAVKPLQDILQKRLWFNDNRIYRIIVDKEVVPKWQEYISFSIETML